MVRDREAPTTKARGDAAEAQALAWLQGRGLVLVRRNYRVAGGPHARGGEVDLILRDPASGTLVFVEVRRRRGDDAAASVDARKQRRIIYAAQCFLRHLPTLPPCRFDVVAIEGGHLQWLPGAFDTAGW